MAVAEYRTNCLSNVLQMCWGMVNGKVQETNPRSVYQLKDEITTELDNLKMYHVWRRIIHHRAVNLF